MAEQNQGDQLEPTYDRSVRIQDVALRTYRKRLTRGRRGERGSGISVLIVRQEDDDDDDEYCDDNSLLAAQLPWLVNLMSLLCYVDWGLSGRVSALRSLFDGFISSWGEYGIHCWWDLIRAKQLSSVSVCPAQVFAGISSHSNLIHYIIPLLKRKCTSIIVFIHNKILCM